EPGAHVREAGSDVREGDLALAAGTVLGPPQLGLLAAVGRDTVRVRPRPRVVVLATGSELVQPGESLAPGQIHDSNSFTLTAAARDAGALAFRVGAIGDDAETLRATIEDQLIRADLVVTSGGVSVGAYDVVKEALTDWTGLPEPAAEGEDADTGENTPAQETEGAGPRGVVFRKLAMQPGKPQGFGTIGRDATPVLALPGNPVSAYVSFELFVRPAIRALAGLADLHRPTVRALVEAPKALTSPAGRRQYLRARHADGRVTPVGGASSHLVGALARANALLVVPEERTSVEPGEEAEVVLLG
ncbi:gephyrin-like molybdotransferase Glp, partial [Streptomyces sp. SID8380]